MTDEQTNRNTPSIAEELRRRVLLLDGSMGVMLQRRRLTESETRGRRFLTHSRNLSANFDILCLSRPEIVAEIHREYLEAGADVIETNSFNANSLSQKEYATEHLVREINLQAARIARREADRRTALTPHRPRFVAGAMGPTAHSASLPVDADNPEIRSTDYATLADAYAEQAAALVEGGVDLLLIETIFDPLNAKAAAAGARRAFRATGREVPLIFSVTLSDASGRMLTGHTPEAFLAAIARFRPLAVGFNCSAGPAGLAEAVRRLSAYSPFATILYPNAGLPDRLGAYRLDAEGFAAEILPLLTEGSLNMAGGCCGTSPRHIAALRKELDTGDIHPRPLPDVAPAWIAGLETVDDAGFINVGERCNVAGSRKFLRLIKEGNYGEALGIARRQVMDGAMVLDINMDDAMLDARAEMTRFLRILGSDPVTAAVPWMIDSSDFGVIEAALGNVAGKGIVNSISLRDGEEEFVRRARVIAEYGAAVVVMLFDEEGQAVSYERKTEVARRAVALLTDRCGFAPRDIIIDANILTVATGIPGHDRFALDYIRAVEWIKENLPGVRTGGGVSNLSFAFRGNNRLRQAMHAVFLHHAVRAGLSMAIMDPSASVAYDDVPPELLERTEDVILCRRADATERLAEIAARYADVKHAPNPSYEGRHDESPVAERLARALRTGDTSRLEADIAEAISVYGGAQAVVEGPLMRGMEEVGRLFGCDRMFLPQVVKSAGTMRRAVDILFPSAAGDATPKRGNTCGKILMATVRGDVHDIGKNIAAVVMRCNNYEVIDLGVQVEAPAIVEAALRYRPDFIGLSGLITPSLGEMVTVAGALREAGVKVPLFVGGAATTELHTALKIASAYGDGLVVRMADASTNPIMASRLRTGYEEEAAAIRERQRRLVEEYMCSRGESGESGCPPPAIDRAKEPIDIPAMKGEFTLPGIPLADVARYINYTYLYKCWQVHPESEEAGHLKEDAERLVAELIAKGAVMRARIAFHDAYSVGDTIVIGGDTVLPTPRQECKPGREECLALADFIAPEGCGDHIGCFVVSIGTTIREALEECEAGSDDYRKLLLQSVCDRLAEACSEWLHLQVRRRYWGYAKDEKADAEAIRQGRYRGIRPAVGYPSLPDQLAMHTLARLVHPGEIGVTVTPNGALHPASSVAGFYFASPRARYFTLK